MSVPSNTRDQFTVVAVAGRDAAPTSKAGVAERELRTALQDQPSEVLLGPPRRVVLLVVGQVRGEVGGERGGQLGRAVARDRQPGTVGRAVEGERSDDQETARRDRGGGQIAVGLAVGGSVRKWNTARSCHSR